MHYEVVVIGGGQAGLAMGYYLQRLGVDYVILEADEQAGAAWRQRWDSLVLFTPAAHSELPGLRHQIAAGAHPTKDEQAAYMVRYAAHHGLAIRYRQRVVDLHTAEEGFRLTVDGREGSLTAAQVVIATGPFSRPYIPAFAPKLTVFNVHSSAYRNPAQLPDDGPVLVVGGGNSGAQIAEELADTHEVTLSRRSKLPYVSDLFLTRTGFGLIDAMGLLDIHVEHPLAKLVDTSGDTAVFGVNVNALPIRLADAAVDAAGDQVMFADGSQMRVGAVVWATGFAPDYDWVHVPVIGAKGEPIQRRGVTPVAGLYFLGLSWMWTRGSALVGWVHRDARYLAEQIDGHRLTTAT